jgi:hypothetical protein
MSVVVFAFRENASEEDQDLARTQVLGMPGVRVVARISPDATQPSLRRFWYADVADDRTASDLVKRLRERSDIESADLPAQRQAL